MVGEVGCMDTDSSLPSTFSSYVASIEVLATDALRGEIHQPAGLSCVAMLDGQIGLKLRETVPMQVRKNLGAFFSSSALRVAAVKLEPQEILDRSPVIDPAMGAGDLLLEVANHLPIVGKLPDTMRLWGSVLHGRDLEPDFVRLAKARLVLLAASRGVVAVRHNCMELDGILPGLQVGDGLDALRGGCSWGHIIMNPPYTHRQTARETQWSSGRTNLAAEFLAEAVEFARAGTRLIAILPDVIRTGSRYGRLRGFVENRLHSTGVKIFGQFDPWTDVDVFILNGVVSDGNLAGPCVPWWDRPTGEKIGDRFEVCVGPVVPHRDPEYESSRLYLHARAIPLGGEFDVSHAERRGFESKTFIPPLVVVRRTSRPGDRSRGIGTLIHGEGEVLVENHLMVLKPKDGTLRACQDVIKVLNSVRAKQWLDDRIRCRHLTVSSIKDVPWSET